jgi:amino acid permease
MSSGFNKQPMSAGLDYDLSEVKFSFRKREHPNFDYDEKISLADSFISFLSSVLGAGTLSMPLVFAFSGWLQAIALICFVGFLSYQSNYALLKVAQRVNGKSYADVAEKALGKSKMAIAVVFMFFLNILGASISYLIVIHWALSTTLGYLAASYNIILPEYMSQLTSG